MPKYRELNVVDRWVSYTPKIRASLQSLQMFSLGLETCALVKWHLEVAGVILWHLKCHKTVC